ncbi:MAG: DUF4342 domain-containing protein [bacterium]|nr:DUF4342 domain-containing protein [bacterium]
MADKREEFKVSGKDIKKKVEELVKEGNVRRIIIKDEKGKTIMEFPVTVGVIGVILAPMLAAVGAVATLAANWTIVVERKKIK